MQNPESESTPKSKVKPLKTKEEFSSLHRHSKSLKDPLTSPRLVQAPVKRKLQIKGSNNIFSTLPQATHTAPYDGKKKHKKRKQTNSKFFQCRVSTPYADTALKITQEAIKVGGDRLPRTGLTALEYSILEDRKWYRYKVKMNTNVWMSFDLRSNDHVPFKNECSLLGLRVVNTGPNIPPISKKLEPLEPPKPPEAPRNEIYARLMECKPASENIIGQTVSVLRNERGIYFNSAPFKSFKWSETKIELLDDYKGDDKEDSQIHLKLVSLKTTAVIGLSLEDYKSLETDIKRWSTMQQNIIHSKVNNTEQKQGDSEALVPSSVDDDLLPRGGLASSPLKPSDRNVRRADFGTIEPAKFYSPPPNNKSIRFSGSRSPVRASSPKSFSAGSLLDSQLVLENRMNQIEEHGREKGEEREETKTIKPAIPKNILLYPRDKTFLPKANLRKDRLVQTLDVPEKSSNTISPSKPQTNTVSSSDKNDNDVLENQAKSPKSPGRRPRLTRALINLEEDDSEFIVEPTEEDFALLRADGYKSVLHRFWDGKVATIGIEDIARLNPRIYVNDNIIWFFLKRYMEKLVGTGNTNAEHILMLDTFFYFTMRSGDGPPSWVSKMPILEKHIIIMPIHERAHWRVAVIVGLDRTLNTNTDGDPSSSTIKSKPAIVILDSLGPTRIYHVVRKVISVLGNVFKAQNRKELDASDYRTMRANVPTQTNSTDCGVFLLHYIEQILSNLDAFLAKVEDTDGRILDMGEMFWKPTELYYKREVFKEELKNMGNVDENDQPKAINSSGSDRATKTVESETGTVANSTKKADINGESDEEDSIEVLGMEKVIRKKR